MGLIYIRVDALCGATIQQAIAEAIELSQRLGVGLQLYFNQKVMYVSPDSNFEDIYSRWKEL